MRQQDQDLLQMVKILRFGLRRIITAAAEAYHDHANSELSRLAYSDSLTGLHNRRFLEHELERHIELYRRYNQPFSLLMLDLDNLKALNDTYGHDIGDAALKHLATVMRLNIRDVDIPCRLGGDEFVILMPETSKNATAGVGERIAATVEKTRFKIGNSFTALQVSYGIASCPEDGLDLETLLKKADISLYEAKQERKSGSQEPAGQESSL